MLLVLSPLPTIAQEDIEVELDKRRLVTAVREARWEETLQLADSLRQRGVDVGTEILFFEGRGLYELSRVDEAEEKLITYVNTAGTDGANYQTALDYILQIRADQEAAELAAIHAQEEAEMLPTLSANMKLNRIVPPSYPRDALNNGIQGWCIVEFTVNENGMPTDAKIVSSEPPTIFDAACLDSIRGRLRYEPATINGRAVSVPGVRQRFDFRFE